MEYSKRNPRCSVLPAGVEVFLALVLGGVGIAVTAVPARAVPANDACAAAIETSPPPFTNTTDATGATMDGTDPTPSCGGGPRNHTVWYKFTAVSSGLVTADTVGSTYDTVLSAYTGACGALIQVAGGCNDDFGGGLTSQIVFPVIAGTTYSVAAASYGDLAGTLVFTIGFRVGLIVNSTTDAVDANPGNGGCATAGNLCTLRAAVQEANALAGADAIFLAAGTYALTVLGSGENAAATGDLDITKDLYIVGAGAATTIIDSAGLGDRTFDIVSATASANLQGLTIQNATAPGPGGGIHSLGSLTLTDCIVRSNHASSAASDGGGLYCSGALTLTNSVVENNSSAGDGGGIAAGAALTIFGSVVRGNGTSGPSTDGGGINLIGSGISQIDRSTISGNTAVRHGGGIRAGVGSSGELYVTNSTLSGNQANVDGGGLYNNGAAITSLRNVTVTNNTADADNNGTGDGGGVRRTVGTVSLADTILAGNTDRGGQAPDCASTTGIASALYNLVGKSDGCNFVAGAGDQVGTVAIPIDPLLGVLQNNGGPTDTHALLPNSPAIGNGGAMCPLTDQRGQPRAFSCDIGAYQVPFTGPTPTMTPTPTVTLTPTRTLSPTLTRTPTVPPAPANDICANATVVSFTPFSDTVDTRGAGIEASDPVPWCDASSAHSVWYRFTAPSSGLVTVNDLASGYGVSTLSAYTGSCGALIPVGLGCGVGGTFAPLSFPVAAGTVYYVMVNSRVVQGGTLLFNLTFRPGFTVNTTSDGVDANPGDGTCATAGGLCTLRAAIQEANASAAADAILLPAGTYALTILGSSEDAGASGDLDITKDLYIAGAGALTTIIDGAALGDRIFDIRSNSVAARFSGLTVRNGNASGSGGGIRDLGFLMLVDCIVSGSHASGDGGGIYAGWAVQLYNSAVRNNGASGDGGGIAGFNTDIYLTNATIDGNQTTGTNTDGGGINLASGYGYFQVVGSTISRNVTTGQGGGIHNGASQVAGYTTGVNISNSTISGNQANLDGGGLYSNGNVGGSLQDVTVANNIADADNNGTGDGGGFLQSAGTLNVTHALIAGNLDRGGQAPDGSCYSFVSSGRNLIGQTDGCTFAADPGDQVGTIATPIDPQLGPLQDNGGPTETQALLPGSPAINGGASLCPNVLSQPLAVDQRGQPRIAPCDIGAYEFTGVIPTATPTSTSTATPSSTPSATSTMTATLTVAASASPSATATNAPTATPTFTATLTPTVTLSPTATDTPTPFVEPPVPTGTAAPLMNPASLLVFPKVIADGTRDTVIQLTNTSNSLVAVRCVYLNEALTETDFSLLLFAQQPTHWVASQGRAVDPTDALCSATNTSCNGAGLDPGMIPPAPFGFRGELLCVQTDDSGAPVSGNSLIGQATLQNITTGAVAQYIAVGLRGFDTNDGDNTLCLGGGVTPQCPLGAEYEGCPENWWVSHVADGKEDPLAGPGSVVHGELTFVSCKDDFANQTYAGSIVQFLAYDQNDSRFLSTSFLVTGWASWQLSDPHLYGPLLSQYLTPYLQARLRFIGGGGIVLLEETLTSGGAQPVSTSAIENGHPQGVPATGTVIVLP